MYISIYDFQFLFLHKKRNFLERLLLKPWRLVFNILSLDSNRHKGFLRPYKKQNMLY